MRSRTILCFASGYDAPPTSKHHVMHLLAERNTVLWVNYHASRTPSASGSDVAHMARKLREVAAGVRRVRGNLYTLTPLVVPLPTSRVARWINRALLVAQIRAALARLRRGPLQVWSFTPDIAYLLDHFDAEKVVYYCVDDFAEFTGYDREQVLRDEADLCRRADLVVTTSQALQESKAPLNPNTVLVPHGVDYAHFARAVSNNLPVPADMRGIPHPILGFFGLIRDWVDLDLLAGVAHLRPEWHIVLIGDADSNVNLEAYRSIPNMHFLGRKPYADLPAYCRCFDVGLVPFKINELTKAVNPIKLREYLAAGVPVVSAPLREVSPCRGDVRIAGGPDETVQAVKTCLAEGEADRLRRSGDMATETWSAKVADICQLLADTEPVRLRTGLARKRGRRKPAKALIGLAGGGFWFEAGCLLDACPPDIQVTLLVPQLFRERASRRFSAPNFVVRGFWTPHRQRRDYHNLRSALAIPISTLLTLKVLLEERPDCVIGLGQRIALYLLIAARICRIKRTVFIETITRATKPTLTGRIISDLQLADRFFVQWPDLVRAYRQAEYAGRLA